MQIVCIIESYKINADVEKISLKNPRSLRFWKERFALSEYDHEGRVVYSVTTALLQSSKSGLPDKI